MEWGVALTATGFILVLLIGGVAAFDLGFEASIAANTVSQVLVMVLVLPFAIRKLSVEINAWNSRLVSRLWFSSIALWGVAIFQSLHWRVGLVAVQALVGSQPLGLYTAAAKLIENLRVIPWFLLMAVLPAFARAGQADQNELRSLVNSALRYISLIVFPLCAILVTLAPVVIEWLYTPDYILSVQVLQICALGLVPLFIHWVFLTTMVSFHQERELMVTYGLSIVVEAALDVWLVPAWGANGAAVGYVVGQCTAALVSGLYVMRALGGLGDIASMRTVMPGLLALALALWLPAGMSRFMWSAATCLVYVLGLFAFKAITPSELRSIVARRSVPAQVTRDR